MNSFWTYSGYFLWFLILVFFVWVLYLSKGRVYSVIANYFFGSKLIDSSKDLIKEYRSDSLSDEVIGEFVGQLLLRLTRLGIYAILIALLPMILLMCQNKLISNQNKLISHQINLDSLNMNLLNSQNRLIESERRSSLVMLMSDIMNQVNAELNSGIDNRGLNPETIARIIAISNAFKPYWHKHYKADTFQFFSPERGQLLSSLVLAEIDTNNLKEIYSNGNFQYSDLEGYNLKESFLKGIDLSFSNLKLTDFQKARLQNSNLSNAYISETNYRFSKLSHSNFDGKIDTSIFIAAELDSVDFGQSLIRRSRFTNSNLVGTNFSLASLHKCHMFSDDFTRSIVASAVDLCCEDVTSGARNDSQDRTYTPDTYDDKYENLNFIKIDSIYDWKNSSFAMSKYGQSKLLHIKQNRRWIIIQKDSLN